MGDVDWSEEGVQRRLLLCSNHAFAADLDVQNETAVLSSEPLEDATNVSQAIASMIYCVHGSACRGGWTWTGPKKVCRGGSYCAPTMAFAADLDVQNETAVLSSEPLEDSTNVSQAIASMIYC